MLFAKLLFAMPLLTHSVTGASGGKGKYLLNTLQKKVLQYYKNKSLYHFGKKRYIIAETTTIRSYGG